MLYKKYFVLKYKYRADNLHKINKPKIIEKVSLVMSYLKIYVTQLP